MTTSRSQQFSRLPRNENALVNGVLDLIRSMDEAWARKVHGSPFQDAGEPDIDACLRGRAVKIELKMPGAEPTPIQYASLRRWERAGALAFWATSVDEVRAFLVGVDDRSPNPQLCKHTEIKQHHDSLYPAGVWYCVRCGQAPL